MVFRITFSRNSLNKIEKKALKNIYFLSHSKNMLKKLNHTNQLKREENFKHSLIDKSYTNPASKRYYYSSPLNLRRLFFMRRMSYSHRALLFAVAVFFDPSLVATQRLKSHKGNDGDVPMRVGTSQIASNHVIHVF